jgi:hypothetical protein
MGAAEGPFLDRSSWEFVFLKNGGRKIVKNSTK